MGEVYRAWDVRLGREVAVKVLPRALSADVQRSARLEREAKLLAQLHHPNIASIFDLEEENGVRALVMELVEGPTLAERLAAGPLPVAECLSIALRIADALSAAHDKGIVHRDLKPQNVKASAEGVVKVLDFGLAKAIPWDQASAAEASRSPTLTVGPTEDGQLLGTAAYMAPEQARGEAVDKRADIWAFGVVLFEMLSGRRLFGGSSTAEILVGVLDSEIDLSRLPAPTPPAVRRLLGRCLRRSPRDRLHDIADARIVLEEVLTGEVEAPAAAAVEPTTPNRWHRLLPWGVAAVAVVLAVLPIEWASRPDRGAGGVAGATAPTSFRQLTFLPGGETTPSLAPDGESVVFAKQVNGQSDLFLQRVDGRNAVLLTSSCPQDDSEPAFSRDGRRIAYRSECGGGGIFVMGATGESARRVADFGYSPAWSPSGQELAVVTEAPLLPYGGLSITSELWVIEVETGARRKVSEHDARHPSWSPDGRRIAFWGQAPPHSHRELWTVASDGSEVAADRAVRLTEDAPADWNPIWSPDGGGLYFSSTRGGTLNLWYVAVELGSGRGLAAPRPVTLPSNWVGWITFSGDGRRLAFVDRDIRTTILRAPFDPERAELAGRPRAVETGSIEVWSDGFDLAPDGSSVLFATTGMPQHLMVASAEGSDLRQLTEGASRFRQATYSPDGSQIALQTTRFPGRMALLRPDGSGLRELVTDRAEGWWPVWSPDGSRLAVSEEGQAYVLALAATSPEGSTMNLPAPQHGMVFSPGSWSADGRWLTGKLREGGVMDVGVGLYSLEEGTYRVIPASVEGDDPHFLSDSRRLVWTTGRELVIYDLDGGPRRTLWSTAPGHHLAAVAPSRDGRWIAWLEAVDESAIWLATFESAAAGAP